MQIRSGIRAGLAGAAVEPLGAAPGLASGPAASFHVAAGAAAAGEKLSLDGLFHNTLVELRLWAQRMLRKYGLSSMQVIETDRFWELDMLRGLALAEMLLVHFIITWLRVLTPSLFLAALDLWRVQKELVIGLGSLLLLGGALATSPTLGVSPAARLFEQHPALRTLLPLAALLLLPALAGWLASAGSGGSAFLLISGISLSISYARQAEQAGARPPFSGYLKRGAGLFAWGLAVSALSFLMLPAHAIVFGILNLLGASTVLAYPFLGLPALASLASGLGIMAAGSLLADRITNPAWQWLVSVPAAAERLDTHMLLPWFGVLLLGVAIGKLLYPQGRRAFRMPDLSGSKLVGPLQWLGRYTLPVYLLHLPVVLAGARLAG